MASATFNPNAGDGFGIGSGANWNTMRSGSSSGFSNDYVGTTFTVSSSLTSGFYMGRVSIPFDTSSIPAGSKVTAATLKLRATIIHDDNNDGNDWVNIYGTTVASIDSWTSADWDEISDSLNSPTAFSTQKDLSSMSANNYYTWTLNASGLAAINVGVGAETKLGMREGHDVENDPMTGTDVNCSATFASKENATSAYRPLLTVTYQPPNMALYLM